MKARIARAGDRAPSCLRLVDKEDVVEEVNRLESQKERRIAVLLENDSGSEGGFEAMSLSRANYPTECPHRIAALLTVVWKRVQPALNRGRRTKPVDQPLLGRGEFES